MSRTVDPSDATVVRRALTHHLGRKLGWSGRTAIVCLGGLSDDDIARCFAVEPQKIRAALFARSCRALQVASSRRRSGEDADAVAAPRWDKASVRFGTIDGTGRFARLEPTA